MGGARALTSVTCPTLERFGLPSPGQRGYTAAMIPPMLASLTALLAASPAPMAELWPYAVKFTPQGYEYAYDVTALKASGGTADARAAHGEPAVLDFLKGLPREVRVKVSPAPLTLAGGRGLERARLSTSFSGVNDGAFASLDPLGLREGARIRPALHPDEPKLLTSVELLLEKKRRLEDGALAAIALDTERLQRELWARVEDKALAAWKAASGDGKEGAAELLVHVAAANSCLDTRRLSKRLPGELQVIAASLVGEFLGKSEVAVPLRNFSALPELTCAWRRARVLAQPLSAGRSGAAAGLVLLGLLETDARAKALYAQVQRRRDAFFGAVEEPLGLWRAAAKQGPAQALEDLGPFLEALGSGREAPLLAWPVTPFAGFLDGLSGAELSAGYEELAVAAAAGGVKPRLEPAASWEEQREAALVPLVKPEADGALQVDAAWRDRLVGAFASLQGASHALPEDGKELAPVEPERSALQVRLWAPPALEVEPLAALWEAGARQLENVAPVLEREGVAGLRALGPDGARVGEPLQVEVRALARLLRGAEQRSRGRAGPEAKALRDFSATFRKDPFLAKDVRRDEPSRLSDGGSRGHVVTLGVARRELTVGFAAPASATVLGERASAFVADATAQQRYLVPVAVNVEAAAPPRALPLPASAVRALVDGAQREVTAASAAVVEAVKALK